ncbi:endonuclease 8-like 1 isoform X2 [Callorhinchus milii]|uniref:endonuclease 8-like 1 isoform X2 n=1 Tax=Callorhinchus milii TaxID=7868 RepID=UPI000457523A|nr:endonuclease 8-like 1 isoform X2 [Callorhinchus milii]|eukprot:gi/632939105/ref/XP_007907676.1/ PREDICTED: endonuclease 8-like 1 [Callorhinchus milii]
MPEGPELHLAGRFVNQVSSGLVFSGKVEKSEVSKNPEVPFACRAYTIWAVSRGKEVKLTLTPLKEEAENGEPKSEGNEPRSEIGKFPSESRAPLDVVFRFGMSGQFKFTPVDELPKHAHLRFYTKDEPRRVLCFVDTRRFGSWETEGSWQPDRGPCVMFEYEKFRVNVLNNLADKAFDKPICEVLLNQKYFNGIGNYLRAEILFRLKVPPFEKARTVLETLAKKQEPVPSLTLSKKVKLKMENPDFLELCNTVPLEVVDLGPKGYDPEHRESPSAFEAWLQCYYVDGMKLLRDSNKRTIWFQGDPGPMAPKGSKVPKIKPWRKKATEENGDRAITPKKEEAGDEDVVWEEQETDSRRRAGRSKGVAGHAVRTRKTAGGQKRGKSPRMGKKPRFSASPEVSESNSEQRKEAKVKQTESKTTRKALRKSKREQNQV